MHSCGECIVSAAWNRCSWSPSTSSSALSGPVLQLDSAGKQSSCTYLQKQHERVVGLLCQLWHLKLSELYHSALSVAAARAPPHSFFALLGPEAVQTKWLQRFKAEWSHLQKLEGEALQQTACQEWLGQTGCANHVLVRETFVALQEVAFASVPSLVTNMLKSWSGCFHSMMPGPLLPTTVHRRWGPSHSTIVLHLAAPWMTSTEVSRRGHRTFQKSTLVKACQEPCLQVGVQSRPCQLHP